VAASDLEAAASWLRTQRRIAKQRIGVMGFCMGGGLALGLALQDSTITATEMFYGSRVTEPAQLASLRGPVQAHFGEKDDGIPPAKADAFRAALKQTGKEGEVYVYAGAGHAFMNETRPSYHADAARQAWARTLAFFQKNLKR
jgi:carboxymethylenebutenolidase